MEKKPTSEILPSYPNVCALGIICSNCQAWFLPGTAVLCCTITIAPYGDVCRLGAQAAVFQNVTLNLNQVAQSEPFFFFTLGYTFVLV